MQVKTIANCFCPDLPPVPGRFVKQPPVVVSEAVVASKANLASSGERIGSTGSLLSLLLVESRRRVLYDDDEGEQPSHWQQVS